MSTLLLAYSSRDATNRNRFVPIEPDDELPQRVKRSRVLERSNMQSHQNMFELHSIPTRFCQENACQCAAVLLNVLGKAPACCNANINNREA
jgi:hypothetical protein